MKTRSNFPKLPLPQLVKKIANKNRMRRPLKRPGETQAEYLERIAPLGPFGDGLSALQIANVYNSTKHSVNVLLNLARLEPEVLEAIENFDRGGVGISRAQVFQLGFLIDVETGQPSNGRHSPINVNVPTRVWQLKLLRDHCGKRNDRRVTESLKESPIVDCSTPLGQKLHALQLKLDEILKELLELSEEKENMAQLLKQHKRMVGLLRRLRCLP